MQKFDCICNYLALLSFLSLVSELDTPTIGSGMNSRANQSTRGAKEKSDVEKPSRLTNNEEARQNQTKPANALPASWRCPGQPRARLFEYSSIQCSLFAFDNGGATISVMSSFIYPIDAGN